MADIIEFPQRSFPVVSHPEPDEEGGPPEGTTAWLCSCGSMAFYLTLTHTVCWDCQTPQVF